MKRSDILLAVLAAAEGKAYQPVQLQKAVFLVSDKLPDLFDGGEGYSFEPFHFGPFDRAVYDDVQGHHRIGLAAIEPSGAGRWSTYSATEQGARVGKEILSGLTEKHRRFFYEVAQWVLKQDFDQLVKSIYKAYPDMAVNSIYRG